VFIRGKEWTIIMIVKSTITLTCEPSRSTQAREGDSIDTHTCREYTEIRNVEDTEGSQKRSAGEAAYSESGGVRRDSSRSRLCRTGSNEH
jgi:hypothetical protein